MSCCLFRAQAIRALLRDEARLGQEREAFRAKARAYTGFSRAQMASPSGRPAASHAPNATPSLRRSVRGMLLCFPHPAQHPDCI
jgi:hypothetical protein